MKVKNKKHLRTVFKNKKKELFALLFFVGIFCAAYFYLHAQTLSVGQNPIQDICEDRSHLAVTGKNYAFNEKQEKAYEEEQKKQEEKRAQKKESQQLNEPLEVTTEQPVTRLETKDRKNVMSQEMVASETVFGNQGEANIQDNFSDHKGNAETTEEGTNESPTEEEKKTETGEEAGEEGKGEEPDKEEESKLPVITCDLEEGQIVRGTFLGFTVHAISYRKEVLDAFHLTVTVNGSKLYSSGTQNGTVSYRTSQELRDGENEIVITAVDKEGYTTQQSYHVLVNAEEEKTEGGTVRVQGKAEVLGLGTIFDEQVPFYEGENLPYVIDRAFKQAGITYRYTGTFDYGFYLQRVYLQGITQGYQIPNPILEKLEAENCSWVGFEKDSLGEKDFYYWSGWLYRMDGYFPEGLSSVAAEDGSVVEILFSLNNGAEYNGTWFSGVW